jgi:hypothetical protein
VFIFDTVKKLLFYTLAILLLSTESAKAQFETSRDSVVQLFGVIMTADSLVGIPAVSIVVKGQNRGTISNSQGVFSIVVLKGDEVEFTHVSYQSKTVRIPKNLEGNQYSIVQLMVADTVYLPVTVLKPRPNPEQFARDFINNQVPDDQYEIARKNTNATQRRLLMATLPADGAEATRMQLNKIATRATYQGQAPPVNILNPAAWADFIQSWKRGDFKRK